jgi:hypothetical protein
MKNVLRFVLLVAQIMLLVYLARGEVDFVYRAF